MRRWRQPGGLPARRGVQPCWWSPPSTRAPRKPSQNPNHALESLARRQSVARDHRTRAVERPATAAAGSSRAGPGARPQRLIMRTVGGPENTRRRGRCRRGPVASTRPASKLGHLQLEDAKQMAWGETPAARDHDVAPAAPGPCGSALPPAAVAQQRSVGRAPCERARLDDGGHQAPVPTSRRHIAHQSADQRRDYKLDCSRGLIPTTLQRISKLRARTSFSLRGQRRKARKPPDTARRQANRLSAAVPR